MFYVEANTFCGDWLSTSLILKNHVILNTRDNLKYMQLKIIKFQDPDSSILSKPTEIIYDFNEKLAQVASGMKEILLSENALGIAAPQVGISKSICAIRDKNKIHFLCNPRIKFKSEDKDTLEEGCLSFPNVFLEVPRAKTVIVVYKDLEGKDKKIEAKGMLARIIQHEVDHLEGVVFLDRA